MKIWSILGVMSHLIGGTESSQWAVIVVGSRGFSNYRHQADACHAYSALTASGIARNKIILFSFDDAAWSPLNPLPGTLYNAPSNRWGAQNVRQTCVVDYRGPQVNIEQFLRAVLSPPHSLRSGKILNSNAADNVFLYFVDHGADEMLLFPDGDIFAASELHATVDLMKRRAKFQHLLIFVEACESGSLFENFVLPDGVLAVTAANSTESSWGTYCPYDFRTSLSSDMVDHVHLNTCLGDLFSVNWIAALESRTLLVDRDNETVHQFLIRVANATRQSQVNYYGDEAVLLLPISTFLGTPPVPDIAHAAA